MRHGKKFNHLSRKTSHRKAMLANMACSLIKYKRITTTLAKAKALRLYVEPLITKSKNDTTHSRRTVFSYLKQKEAITELFGDISVKIADRQGGYTRILKLGNRLGDNAKMAFIELVDYNEEYKTDKPKRKKGRRARKKNIQLSDNVNKDAILDEKGEIIAENLKDSKGIIESDDSKENIVLKESVEEISEVIDDTDIVVKEDSTEEKDDAVNKNIVSKESVKEIAKEINDTVVAEKDENKEEANNSENKEEKGE